MNQRQQNALIGWVGIKHGAISRYFDTENPEQGDKDNIKLAEDWFDAIINSPVYKGTVYKGTVYKGTVYKGTVYKGTVYKGTVYKGTVYKGTVYKGTVYRGLCANENRNNDLRYIEYLFTLIEGDSYTLARPCSSTVSETVGKDWAIPNEENKNIDHLSVLLICDVVSGRDIRGGPKHEAGDEEEIVLLHKTNFIVTKEKNILNNGKGLIKQKILWLKETCLTHPATLPV